MRRPACHVFQLVGDTLRSVLKVDWWQPELRQCLDVACPAPKHSLALNWTTRRKKKRVLINVPLRTQRKVVGAARRRLVEAVRQRELVGRGHFRKGGCGPCRRARWPGRAASVVCAGTDRSCACSTHRRQEEQQEHRGQTYVLLQVVLERPCLSVTRPLCVLAQIALRHTRVRGGGAAAAGAYMPERVGGRAGARRRASRCRSGSPRRRTRPAAEG